MARVFSDMSLAGPSSVQLAFLYLLQLLVGCICRPHRRGCLHYGRFRWEDSFGSAADQRLAAMLRAREDSNTAGQRKVFYGTRPDLSTWSVEEYADHNGGSSGNCPMTILPRLFDCMRRVRSTATPYNAGSCTWVCRRDDGIEQTPCEGSGDNFQGCVEMIGTSIYTCVAESTASRRRATANGCRAMSRRRTNNQVELYTSTCQDDRYAGFPDNQHFLSSNERLLQFYLNCTRHVLDRGSRRRVSIDHDNYFGDWSWPSLLCTIGDLDLLSEVFSEHWSRRLWMDYSSEKILVRGDVDSHADWREESSIDYSTGTASESHDGSWLEWNSACSDTDTESDTDTQCSETLHGLVNTSTSHVNFVWPRSADSDTASSSSSTRLSGSTNDASSWTTEQQPGDTDDMDDDCDSMHSSITTEELLVRQPDDVEETGVSMAQEQAGETPDGSDVGTSSAPWWSTAGFKFLPTDKEIVLYYLKRKVLNRRLPAHHAVEEGHNIYALDADRIPLNGNYGDEERRGFFFVHKLGGYNNGCYYRTPAGYWRIRGRPTGVNHRGRTVAFKTAMDFHWGRPPHGCRSPWSMFEYVLNTCEADLLNLEKPCMNCYVVCKIRWRESKMSAKEKRWRRPGLLPRRPSLKKTSPRRCRKMISCAQVPRRM